MTWRFLYSYCWRLLPMIVATGVFAYEQKPPGAAEDLLEAGLAFEKQAEASALPADAVKLFEKAIERYHQATQLKPDFHDAHAQWSECLLNIAQLTDDAPQRRAYLDAAFARFGVAVHCPDADWSWYQQWGVLLAKRFEKLANSLDEKRLILGQMRQAFVAGLDLAHFSAQRARLERDLGLCLAHLADQSPDPSEKRKLYAEAVTRFESVIKARPDDGTADVSDKLGYALLRLGKLDNDPALLRRAVEVLQSILTTEPRSMKAHYNLACAYAFLNQPAEAIEHLRAALDNDPGRQLSQTLSSDTDFDSLRGIAAFRTLLKERSMSPNPDEAYRAGREAQELAELASSPEGITNHLEQAITQYRCATQARPDFYLAHVMWARCLSNLARRATDPAQRQGLVRSARDRYAEAARCTGADAHLYLEWGKMLAWLAEDSSTNQPERRRMLADARVVLEAGLKRAQPNKERPELERILGGCLLMSAEATSELAEKHALLTLAAASFERAMAPQTKEDSAGINAAWGATLMQLGKFNHDSVMLRQAVDRLQRAASEDAKNPALQFNLACCYALLGQSQLALRHLRLCFENDPQRRFAALAEKEPDINPLRRTAEYHQLLGEDTAKLPSPFLTPPVRNQ